MEDNSAIQHQVVNDNDNYTGRNRGTPYLMRRNRYGVPGIPVKTTYVYDAFGNATVSGESTDNPFQFAGRENDGTGLLHERYRDYSFELQRYISEDPIRLRGGDVNFYVRTGNDPVNRIDPLGLDWIDDLSNFSAGMGDVITLGGTRWVRQQMGSQDTVDSCSGYYTAGRWAGYGWWTAFGSASLARSAGWTTRISLHGPHHTFGSFGNLSHIQMNYWQIGVKGTGGALRIPLPW